RAEGGQGGGRGGGGEAGAPPGRLLDPGRQRGAPAGFRHRALPSRETRRKRLSPQAERRSDSARSENLLGGRLPRRDDFRPSLPQSPQLRRRPFGDYSLRRYTVRCGGGEVFSAGTPRRLDRNSSDYEPLAKT